MNRVVGDRPVVALSLSKSSLDSEVGHSPAIPFPRPLQEEQRELLVRKATMLLVDLDRYQGNSVFNIAMREQIMAELRSLAIPLWFDGRYDD